MSKPASVCSGTAAATSAAAGESPPPPLRAAATSAAAARRRLGGGRPAGAAVRVEVLELRALLSNLSERGVATRAARGGQQRAVGAAHAHERLQLTEDAPHRLVYQRSQRFCRVMQLSALCVEGGGNAAHGLGGEGAAQRAVGQHDASRAVPARRAVLLRVDAPCESSQGGVAGSGKARHAGDGERAVSREDGGQAGGVSEWAGGEVGRRTRCRHRAREHGSQHVAFQCKGVYEYLQRLLGLEN